MQMQYIVGLQYPAMCLSKGRMPLHQLMVPCVRQCPIIALGGKQHEDIQGRGGVGGGGDGVEVHAAIYGGGS